MHDRRSPRPYYRRTYEQDRFTAIVTVTLMVGVLIGVTVTLGWLDLTGGV